MSMLETLYQWSPDEIAAWRQFADAQPDSITRNKINELLDAYENSAKTEFLKQEAKEAADRTLESFKTVLKELRKGVKKTDAERVAEVEELIQEMINDLSAIVNWKFDFAPAPIQFADQFTKKAV